MKAIKKVAAKAAGKVKLEYVDETRSMISEDAYGDDDEYSDYDESNIDAEVTGEVTKNWEKISQGRRYHQFL